MVKRFVILLIMFSFTMTGCLFYNSPHKLVKIQKGMENYLKQTYEKVFVVAKPELSGDEAFGYRVYAADAYQKDKPEYKFTVTREIGEPGKYSDDYLEAKWSYQGKKEIEDYLKQIYDDDVWVKFDYEYSYKKFKNMDYDEVEKNAKGGVFKDFSYYIFMDTKDFNKDLEATRIYQVYKKFIVDTNTKKYYFDVYFLSKAYKNEVLKLNGDIFQIDRSREILIKKKILINDFGLIYSSPYKNKMDFIKNFNY